MLKNVCGLKLAHMKQQINIRNRHVYNTIIINNEAKHDMYTIDHA